MSVCDIDGELLLHPRKLRSLVLDRLEHLVRAQAEGVKKFCAALSPLLISFPSLLLPFIY